MRFGEQAYIYLHTCVYTVSSNYLCIRFYSSNGAVRTFCSSSSIHLDSGTTVAHSGGLMPAKFRDTLDIADLICFKKNSPTIQHISQLQIDG